MKGNIPLGSICIKHTLIVFLGQIIHSFFSSGLLVKAYSQVA